MEGFLRGGRLVVFFDGRCFMLFTSLKSVRGLEGPCEGGPLVLPTLYIHFPMEGLSH